MSVSVVWGLIVDEHHLEEGIADAQKAYERAAERTRLAMSHDRQAYAEVERLRRQLKDTTDAINTLAARDDLSDVTLANWRKTARGEESIK